MDKLEQSMTELQHWGPITYVPRIAYGKELLDPAKTNAISQLVCSLAGTRTLGEATIRTLRAYGVEVKQSDTLEDYIAEELDLIALRD
jgi:hypothetical protein